MTTNSPLIEGLEKELSRKREEVQALEQALEVLRGNRIEGRQLLNLPKTREFEGLGITDAATRLLKEKGPMATRDLADMLQDRGIKTRSKNYVATVFATLTNAPSVKRNKKNEWELIEGKGDKG